MDPYGEIVGVYKEESTPGDVANEGRGVIAIFRNDGNVGIGTSCPQAKLHIDPGSGSADLALAGSRISDDYDGVLRIQSGGGNITVNNDAIVVDHDGNVGIGTTDAGAKLTIADQGSDQTHGHSAVHIAACNEYFDYNCGIVMRGQGSGWATRFTSTDEMYTNGEIVGIYKQESTPGDVANGAGDVIAIFRNDGNVGIGTATPGEKLHVVGNICYTGSIGACSDARFKKNVEPISNALAKVEKLQGVHFDWKRDEYPDQHFSKGRQVGFIAQELKEILPEVVFESSDGHYSIDYGRVVPTLVEAVKDLHENVKHKDAQIAELSGRLAKMETLVAELAEQVKGDAR